MLKEVIPTANLLNKPVRYHPTNQGEDKTNYSISNMVLGNKYGSDK